MIKHSIKIAACSSILGIAVLAHDAMALTEMECEDLSGNQFLAAVERGECDIDIQTAAGPQEEAVDEQGSTGDRDGRSGGGNNGGGSGNRGGGNKGGRSGGAAPGKP